MWDYGKYTTFNKQTFKEQPELERKKDKQLLFEPAVVNNFVKNDFKF